MELLITEEMATLFFFLSSCVSVYFLILLVKFFNKVWFHPLRVQSLMNSQGLKGPSYKFLYGNTTEILAMINEFSSSPMELSHHIFPRIQPHIYSWIKIYGMNILSWCGPGAQIIVTDPDMVKEVMNNKHGGYQKPEMQTYGKKLLGDGLVTSEGEKWSKMRKLANHAFSAESLKGMVPAMVASAETMLGRWKEVEGKEIDVVPEFKILTSEVISRTAFGSSYKEGQRIFDSLISLGTIISRNLYKIRIPIIGKFLQLADDMESDKLQQEIKDSIVKMVKKREEEALMLDDHEVDSYGTDFLGLLVKAYNDADEGNRISINDLVDECKTIYIAGQESTAITLSWTLLLVAIHQDWQDKVRNEVLQLFGHQTPKPDGISKLKIMSMVIHESLRLYPPVPYVLRKAGREIKMGELTVPADMTLFMSILALHHNPKVWGEDVHVFKPDRFVEGVAKATGNNMAAFIPFASGPRICAGFNFALTELKIVLSMILQRYRITLSPSYIHSPVHILTIQPQHGVQVILHPL